MANLTTVGLTAGAGSSGTGTVSTLDNVIGAAGTANTNVQTVQGIASMTPLKVDGSGVTQPVSIASLPSGAVTNAGTFAVQNTAATPAGTNVIGHVIVDTAPSTAVTNAGTFAVQADSTLAQNATTSGQKGVLIQGAVTTAGPTYTTAQTSPLSLDTSGNLRVNVVAGGAGGGAVTNAGTFAVQVTNANANGSATSANSAPVVIASDQGAVKTLVSVTATANGTTSSRVNSAASTNATSLKASAGQGYEIDVFNVAAYNVFLKFYNKASAPTVGTDTPIWTIPVAAGGGYSKSFKSGKTFSTGIAYAITKLQADSDTTVVAAGDLTGSIDWI